MLYDRVKQLCSNEGITITELERTLKFGNGTIHNWNKSEPSVAKAMAVAQYFGVGAGTLLFLIQSFRQRNPEKYLLVLTGTPKTRRTLLNVICH